MSHIHTYLTAKFVCLLYTILHILKLYTHYIPKYSTFLHIKQSSNGIALGMKSCLLALYAPLTLLLAYLLAKIILRKKHKCSSIKCSTLFKAHMFVYVTNKCKRAYVFIC